MEESRIDAVEKRLDDVEEDLQRLRKNVHDIKNEQQVMVGQLSEVQKVIGALHADTAKVLTFFEGTDKLFGFCRKHWRTGLKFGCGVVTAWGVSNPHVTHTVEFIGKFFGL